MARNVVGWESFQDYHRMFFRNVIVFLLLTLALLVVGRVPAILHAVAVSLVRFLKLAWVVFTFYFVLTNARRHSRLLCPQCGHKFFGRWGSWNPYKCHHCGVKMWASVPAPN